MATTVDLASVSAGAALGLCNRPLYCAARQQRCAKTLTRASRTHGLTRLSSPGASSPLKSKAPGHRVETSRLLPARSQSEPQSSQSEDDKIPFGYTRKDVILIGLGLTVFGFGLRYGLEYGAGLDGIQAGNVVQLVMVLGLCLGWVSTYLWRVGNKEMTYAQQLRDYEAAVMEKRLEALSETELEAMLAEVEEEKERLRAKKANLKE